MNLIGSYQHHHHHMMPDPFIFSPGSRCHQERPYFQGWVLNPGEVSPEFPAQPSYSPEYGAVVGPSQTSGRMENLGGKLGRRKGAPPKKERRRTESINSAFAELRECIPNVPADTKLSKIKTLRLATSYIGYLMDVLAKDSEPGDTEAFKAEIKKVDGKRRRESQPTEGYWGAAPAGEKKLKGRTGWPQQVWALELNP